MGQWVRAQVKVANIWIHVLIVTSPPENAKPKTKNVFFGSQLEDLLNP